MSKYEISLEELFAPIKKAPRAKPKSSQSPRRLPGEPRAFVKHLTPPQFLNGSGQIHSARAKQEHVRRAGPDALLAEAAEKQAVKKTQGQLFFALYTTKFLCHLLEYNHD